MRQKSSGRSILVVDDDAGVRALLVDVLHTAGLSVTAVGLIEEALEVVHASRPALIILDLGMPQGKVQGMDFLATLRETDAWKTIPVVILSALGDVVNRDITTRLGVVAVLSKPLSDMEQLVVVARQVLASGA